MANRIVLNETSYHGKGAVAAIADEVKGRGFTKAFLCSDPDLLKFGVTQQEYRKAAVDAVRQLSQDVGIPADLKEIVKEEDIPFLAQSAYDDACRPGNPRDTSVEEIAQLYRSLI